jgi:hypothetical protein
MHTEFWLGNLFKHNNLEDREIYGRISFKMNLWQVGRQDQRQIELVLDCVQWRALVLAVLNVEFYFQSVSYFILLLRQFSQLLKK